MPTIWLNLTLMVGCYKIWAEPAMNASVFFTSSVISKSLWTNSEACNTYSVCDRPLVISHECCSMSSVFFAQFNFWMLLVLDICVFWYHSGDYVLTLTMLDVLLTTCIIMYSNIFILPFDRCWSAPLYWKGSGPIRSRQSWCQLCECTCNLNKGWWFAGIQGSYEIFWRKSRGERFFWSWQSCVL